MSFLLVEGQDISVRCRAEMLSSYDRELKAAVIIGPFQKVKAIYAALVTNAKVTVDAGGEFLKKDELGYRIQYVHMAGKWAIGHIKSLDPRILWAEGDEGLEQMLASPRFETPFLPEWIPAIAKEMRHQKRLVPMQGYQPRGWFCLATNDFMDKLVTRGVRAGALKMPVGASTGPLTATTIEEYVNQYAQELGKKVEKAMKPVHDPAIHPPHPLIAGLPTKLYEPQAHGATAIAKLLQRKRFAYIAWNMGTGKTAASLVACHIVAQGKPYRTVVACPPHLVEKWKREVHKFLGNDVHTEIIQDWKHFVGLRKRPKPTRPEFYIIAMTRAKLSYSRRAAIETAKKWVQYEKSGKRYRQAMLCCPACRSVPSNYKGEPATLEDLAKKWMFCDQKICRQCRAVHGPDQETCRECHLKLRPCAEAFWQASEAFHVKPKVSPADYGRKRMKSFFDFLIRDEAHGSKSADSLDGFACSALMQMAKRAILMTGTFLAGKAEDIRPILFKSLPYLFVPRGFGWKDEMAFAERYGRIDTIKRETKWKDGSEDRKQGRGSNRSVTQVIRPGIMPRIFSDFCAEHVAFLSLHEMSKNLPPYSEHTFPIAMPPAMQVIYDGMKKEFAEWFRDLYRSNRRLSMKLLGPMLEVLITWPDDPIGWPEVAIFDDLRGVRIPILQPPDFFMPPGQLLPKEQALLEMIQQEKQLHRKVWIYSVRDDTRDRLYAILQAANLRVAHLRSSVKPDRREAWIRENAMACDVGLCHPELVETGLELFDPKEPLFNFPTLQWYSTGFKLNTVRQASRRVWRIGQTRQCKTNYLFYEGSAQQEAIALMGKKLVSAEAIEGKFTDGGLVDEAGDDDLALSIARNLSENIKTAVVSTWKPVASLQSSKERQEALLARIAEVKGKLARRVSSAQPVLFA